MEWTVPEFSKKKVNAAGRVLVNRHSSSEDMAIALGVINNWRSSHSFPLNTFQNGLRQRAKQIENDVIIAQRIKRLSSIEHKLKRYPTMTLSQMQDIGGCRAVLTSIRNVRRLVENYRNSDIKHKLFQIDDYISDPKESGYRGIHLIYRYNSDRKPTYNSLKIEIQVRSHIQHAWATAVETVGTFLAQALKSSQGQEQWLRFFALMGTAFAQQEGTAPVPNTPSIRAQLIQELNSHVRDLDILNKLRAYSATLNILGDPDVKGAKYFLLELIPSEFLVRVRNFSANQSEWAVKEYLRIENEIASKAGAEAVLVSVESIAALRRAYPNYFLDTHAFISLVSATLKSRYKKRARKPPDNRQQSLF